MVEENKTQLKEVKEASEVLILSIYKDTKTNEILFGYGDTDLEIKNIYEIIGVLEEVKGDLFKMLKSE